MKKLILLAILLSVTASYAIPGNNGEGNGGCGVGQQTNGCGGSSNGDSNELPSSGSSSINTISNTNGGMSSDINNKVNINSSNSSNISNAISTDVSNVSSSDSVSRSASSAGSNSGGNSVSGGSIVSSSVYKQASAPAIAPNVAASGNNGISLGVQTIAGGFSTGISRVDKSQKELNKANAEYARAAAMGTLVDNILKLETCTSDVCKKAAQLVLRKLGGK